MLLTSFLYCINLTFMHTIKVFIISYTHLQLPFTFINAITGLQLFEVNSLEFFPYLLIMPFTI